MAGFIDSDGSVILRKAGIYFQPVIRVVGQNAELLYKLQEKLKEKRFSVSLRKIPKGGGKTWSYSKDYFTLEVYKRKDVFALLKTSIFETPRKNYKEEIDNEVTKYILRAQSVYLATH